MKRESRPPSEWPDFNSNVWINKYSSCNFEVKKISFSFILIHYTLVQSDSIWTIQSELFRLRFFNLSYSVPKIFSLGYVNGIGGYKYRVRNRNCPPFTTVEGDSSGSTPCRIPPALLKLIPCPWFLGCPRFAKS